MTLAYTFKPKFHVTLSDRLQGDRIEGWRSKSSLYYPFMLPAKWRGKLIHPRLLRGHSACQGYDQKPFPKFSNIGRPKPLHLKTSIPPMPQSTQCPACHAPFKGRFCYQCGEKKLEPEEMTLRYFFGLVWNALTFTDVKFLRTMQALLFKPGRLTAEYFAGRRKLFMAPLALFFFINLVYFVYQPVDALNSSLASQTSGQSYSQWASQVVSERIENSSMNISDFSLTYNQMSEQVSKLFLIVFVFFFAMGTALVNVRRKSLFYFHLIAATHYVSFAILSVLIILPFLAITTYTALRYFAEGSIPSFNPNAWYATLPILFLLGGYAFAMQKRLYTEGIFISLLKALPLLVAFCLSVVLYRLFLFVVVMGLV